MTHKILNILLAALLFASCLGGTDGAAKGNSDNANCPYAPYGYALPRWTTTPSNETILEHNYYVVSYNNSTLQANYVAWTLVAQRLESNYNFTYFNPDPDLAPKKAVDFSDYTGSGYDRGHLCPRADNGWDSTARTECNYLSNACPQNHTFNDGIWKALEIKCRKWARQGDTLHIVTGPVFFDTNDGSRHIIGKGHHMPVPDAFFKAIKRTNGNKQYTYGFIFTHDTLYHDLWSGNVGVDSLQSLLDITFF